MQLTREQNFFPVRDALEISSWFLLFFSINLANRLVFHRLQAFWSSSYFLSHQLIVETKHSFFLLKKIGGFKAAKIGMTPLVLQRW
jgi:hypothetical protein